MGLILDMLPYFYGFPPPYDARLDLNSDGLITILDVLAAIALI
jgi:hypothetical protein